MVKTYLIFGFVFLLLIQIVAATNTEINVKTLPGHKVEIFVYKVEGLMQIETFTLISPESGKVSTTYTGNQGYIDIRVKITKDGETVLNEKFEAYATGETAYLQLIPGDILADYSEFEVEEIIEEENITEEEVVGTEIAATVTIEEPVEEPTIEEPIVEETIIEEIEEPKEVKNSITGQAISDNGIGSLPNTIYYIIGAVMVVALALVLILKRMAHHTVKPISSPEISDKTIEDLETKIQNAQKEINKFKNKGRIKAAQKKIEDDKKSLERLEKGEE